jgi:SAM-dependent methyltransferase
VPSNPFDSTFYRRFYVDPRTRVTTPAEMQRRARAVAALVTQLELPVKAILDAGCGLGLMRPALLREFPRSSYLGLEVSEHLCRRFGWTQASLAGYRTRTRFDLIICYDVMQYLSDREAARALANLGRWCRGALYFHAPTLEDWRRNADRSCSDGNVHLRDAEWYRSRLARQFRHVGFGVHVRRGVWCAQWELERPIRSNGREK